jgi:glutathione S-transferase
MRSGETVISQDKKEQVFAALNAMEGFLDGQDWFSGNENVSIADLSFLATFSTIYHIGLNIANYPNLSAWYERCSALPGYAQNEEGAKMLASFIRKKLTEPF